MNKASVLGAESYHSRNGGVPRQHPDGQTPRKQPLRSALDVLVWTHVFLIAGAAALMWAQRWILPALLTGSLCSSLLYHVHREPSASWLGAADRLFARICVVVFNGIGFALNPAPLMIVLIAAGFVCFVKGQAYHDSRQSSPHYRTWHSAFHGFAFIPTMMICVQLAGAPDRMVLPGDNSLLSIA